MATDTHTIGDVQLELVVGNIADQPDVDAVVNAANAQLQPGGGVAGAIHSAAGVGLAEECAPMAPIEVSQAVITGGHDLPNPHVIHVLGPVYGSDEPSDQLLSDSYRHALFLAEREELSTIAFPALSTGAFGYPKDEAADIAMRAVVETAPRLDHIRVVRFVFFDESDLQVHRDALAGVQQEQDAS